VRKQDVNGKLNAFSIGKDKKQQYLSASTEANLNKWIKAIKSIKDHIEETKMKEKE
jgi:hypothetical protein